MEDAVLVESLEAARDLVRGGWCQFHAARDEAGRSVNHFSRGAVEFCLTGAIRRATLDQRMSRGDDEEIWNTRGRAYLAAHLALGEIASDKGGSALDLHIVVGDLARWNDDEDREQEDVSNLLDRAAVKARGLNERDHLLHWSWELGSVQRWEVSMMKAILNKETEEGA